MAWADRAGTSASRVLGIEAEERESARDAAGCSRGWLSVSFLLPLNCLPMFDCQMGSLGCRLRARFSLLQARVFRCWPPPCG